MLNQNIYFVISASIPTLEVLELFEKHTSTVRLPDRSYRYYYKVNGCAKKE